MAEIPRIPFDELPADLKAQLAPRVERLGYLGEFFQLGAHQPEALGHFIALTETLKAKMPENLTELTALTIATWSGNAYERVQHERLALKLGFSESWVRTIERLAPLDAHSITPVERAAQALVLAVAKSQGREAGAEAEAFLALADAETLVGLLFTIGRYLAHAAFCNTLQVAQPFPSPIAD